jgi:hypothetical protein
MATQLQSTKKRKLGDGESTHAEGKRVIESNTCGSVCADIASQKSNGQLIIGKKFQTDLLRVEK